MEDKCPFDTLEGCTAILCYDSRECNVRLREQRNVGIIKQFRDIEDTGILPPGFRWGSIQWEEGKGWMGWVWGPNGCNDCIRCRKIPDELLVGVHDCQKTIGYLDLRDKYPVDSDDQ